MKKGSEQDLTVEKERERIVSKGGNSSILYLPKEYFTPGEKVNSRLEIDSEGNLKMVLTKRLFNFTCDTIKGLIDNDFNIEYDKTVADTKVFSANQGNLSLNCTKSPQELEPTYVSVSRRFDQIRSVKDYTNILNTLKRLLATNFDAYIEPEGDMEALQIFKDPQRYKLKDEFEAIEALSDTGRKIGFSIIVRFNSKKNNLDQIKNAFRELSPEV